MTEDVKISKIIELADKYNLKVENYRFSSKFDLKLSCGLLVARVDYTEFDDLVVNIEMPEKYVTGFPSDEGHRFILCQGWMQAQGLFSFERKVKFLLENLKRCEVECRKLDLESDFK